MKKYFPPIPYCEKCKGQCCKNYPGLVSPRNIIKLYPSDALEISVLKALSSGLFAIDWLDDDRRVYKFFVRPAVKEKYILGKKEKRWKIYDPTWGGECVFLTKKGCKLPFELRPENCKIVEPSDNQRCTSHYKRNPKIAFARRWGNLLDLSQFKSLPSFKVQNKITGEIYAFGK